MYHICRYPKGHWNIYCDTTSSTTGCCDTLQEALNEPFSTTVYDLERFEKRYECRLVLSVHSLLDIEHLYPELLI